MYTYVAKNLITVAMYKCVLKSGCQRKPGKMLKMSTEGDPQNKFLPTS